MGKIRRFIMAWGVCALGIAWTAYAQWAPLGAGYVAPSSTASAGGANSSSGGQPNPALKADQQEVATASAALEKAESTLDVATVKATADFHKTAPYITAERAVDDAASAVEKARDAVLARLHGQPDYQAAVTREAEAKGRLATLTDNGADRDAIIAASLEADDASGVPERLQKEALDSDAAFRDALAKLTDARAARVALDDNFNASLAGNPEIASLSQKRNDAQSQLTSAQSKLHTDENGNANSMANQSAHPTGAGG